MSNPFSKGKTPDPPNAAAVSAAQGAANRDTAIAQSQLNMVNQNTPGGSLSYSQRGTGPDGTPLYTATTSLSPEQQMIYDQQTGITQDLGILAGGQVGRINDAVSQPFNLDGLAEIGPTDEAARGATRDRMLARLEPQFAKDEGRLTDRLMGQGIMPGTAAWTEAYDDMTRGRNDARLAADVQAGGEMSRTAALQQALRQQGIGERSMVRNQPINELSALMGAGGGVQGPTFGAVPQTQIAGTDVAGPIYANYQGQLNNQAQRQQSQNAGLGGLAGLGASALGGWARSW